MSKFHILPPETFRIDDSVVTRQFKASDAEELLRLAMDPLVTQYVPWAKYVTDRDSAEKRIAEFNESRFNKIRVRYALESNGAIFGYIGCWPDKKEDYYEFGFAMLPESRGKGLGTRAAVKLIEVLKAELGAKGIVAYVDDTNEASKATVTKLGFKPLEEFDDGDRRYELSLE